MDKVRIVVNGPYERRDGQWVGEARYILSGDVLTRLRVGPVELTLVRTDEENDLYVLYRAGGHTMIWKTDWEDLPVRHPALADVLGLGPAAPQTVDALGLSVGESVSVTIVEWQESMDFTGPAGQ